MVRHDGGGTWVAVRGWQLLGEPLLVPQLLQRVIPFPAKVGDLLSETFVHCCRCQALLLVLLLQTFQLLLPTALLHSDPSLFFRERLLELANFRTGSFQLRLKTGLVFRFGRGLRR